MKQSFVHEYTEHSVAQCQIGSPRHKRPRYLQPYCRLGQLACRAESMSHRLLTRYGMNLRHRQTAALGISVAGLALMLAVVLADLAPISDDPKVRELQLLGMVVGSLLAVYGSYAIDNAWAKWITRLGGALWFAMAFLSLTVSSEKWSGYYLLHFALTGGLVWMSGCLLAPHKQAIARRSEPLPASQKAPTSRAHRFWPVSKHWIAVLSIGLLCCLLCLGFRLASDSGAGDFHWALGTAQSLLSGQDPYGFVPSAIRVPYPLPVALFGLPIIMLPPPVAAAVFFGFSAMLLSCGILRADHPWRLLVFLSIPFWQAAMFAQWAPLITAAWFFPILAPLLVLVKPQAALPVALNRLTWRGVLLAILVLAVSLAIFPGWPVRWIQMIGEYETIIPALMLPLGPFLLLAALFPHDPRARLLLFMSVLPMRAEYDLIPLYLIPSTASQMLILVALSLWNPIRHLYATAGYHSSEGINSYHFYALCILLYSNHRLLRSTWQDLRGYSNESLTFVLARVEAMTVAHLFLAHGQQRTRTMRLHRG